MGVLSVEQPDVFSQLLPGQSNVESITCGSGRVLKWLCTQGHVYECSVFKRVKRGIGCPFCAGTRVLPGFNDVATTHPAIALKWVDDSVLPTEVTAGSKKKVLWDCGAGHVRSRVVRDIVQGVSCRECYDKKRVSTIRLLRDSSLFQELVCPVEERALHVHVRSSESFSWVCAKGHIFDATVKNRDMGRGCPFCAGTRVLPGVNTFSATFPDSISLLADPLQGETVTAWSSRKLQWVCPLRHSFSKEVQHVSSVLRRGGEVCPVCAHRVLMKGVNDLRSRYPALMDEWGDGRNPSDILGSSVPVLWKCSAGHSWQSTANDRSRRNSGCPQCSASGGEKELRSFLVSILPDNSIVFNDRSVISPFELDVFVPEKKIAVEFNGVFWHSEDAGKDKNYHRNKWQLCADRGIQLITIWEDDWRDKNSVVKSMLARKLGVSSEKRIPARACELTMVDSVVARDFMESHHVQGFAPGSKYYALVFNGNIVAVLIALLSQKRLLITRYASAGIVQGGFGKLLKYCVKENPGTPIVTFADLEVSDGKLYERLGFELKEVLSPEYKYVFRGKRYHKFGFRKKRFKNDPNLVFDSSLTERELATLNGISRVWDCGKLKYELSP